MKIINKFLLIPLLLISCMNANAQCDVVENLPDTVKMCAYTPYEFTCSIAGTLNVLSIAWTPSAGMSDTTIIDPTLITPGTSGNYYITVNAITTTDQVINGSFDSIVPSQFTTGYLYGPDGAYSLFTPGQCTITIDPLIGNPAAVNMSPLPPCTYMFAINGLGNVPHVAWQQTVAVVPNTNYVYSAWFANWLYVDTTLAGAPEIQFQINGAFMDRPIYIRDSPSVWQHEYILWNSGVNTTVTLAIFDSNISGIGNAFAIDSITLTPYCSTIDSVYFQIATPDSTKFIHDTSVCASVGSITLDAPSGYFFYTWSNGATTPIDVVAATNNYVSYSYQSCAVRLDTFKTIFIPMPVDNVPEYDTFCQYDTFKIKSVQDSGITFTWNTGSTSDSLLVTTAGTYWLLLNNQGCTIIDTFHVTQHFQPLVSLGLDSTSCNGSPLVLQSTYNATYPPTVTYLWTSGWTAYDTTVGVSGTYWLQVSDSGCVGSDTIHVQILWDTLHFLLPDTVAICKGTAFQTDVTGDPNITYQWIPTTGMAASNIAAPLISTDTSAWYVLTATDGNCPVFIDSFFLYVEPTPQLYLGGYRNVCEYDTLHIGADVNPPFSGYTYSWSPATNLDNDTSLNVVFYSNFTTTDTTTLYMNVTTSAGCNGLDSVYVYSHPRDSLYLGSPIVYLCPGTSLQLFDSGAAYYQWSPGLYLSDSTSATPIISPIASQIYTVIGTTIFGCKDTLTMNVTVYPNAFIALPDTVIIYPGQTVQFTPYTNCVNFQWFPPEGLSSSVVSDPYTQPTQNSQFIVVGSTENSCVASDTVNVIIDQNTILAIPNAFTPGRGVNSILYIIKQGLATLNYFRIFDRWGNKVFETNNIEQGWDGTYNGAAQPFGVYVYEVQAVTNTGELFYKTGNITLLR